MGRKSNAQKAQEAAERSAAEAAQRAAAEAVANKPASRREEQEVEQSKDPRVDITPRDDDRDNAMNEIIEKRGRVEETNDDVEPSETKEPEAVETKEPEAKEAPEQEIKEPEPPVMVKVKVDGEEFEVPKEEIDAAGSVAAYQRERAAENRLKRANETLAESRKVQAQIAQWMEQNTKKDPVETDDQFIASRMDILRFGTQEESAAAMKEILSRTNKTIDQNAVTELAVQRIRQDTAIKEFEKEFSEITSNPLLYRLAVSIKDEKLSKAKEMPDWSNFYRSIGNEIRSVVGKPNQQSTANEGEGKTSQSKEERKSSIVNLPTAASRAAVPEATKPESREDVLNEMRKARGLHG